MFREDEKEEKGVLLFLALLIALIVAGIFGFAVYQSGAVAPLVGDAHVIGKKVSDDLAAPVTAAAGTAAAALASQNAERVEYDHAADAEHQAEYGSHTHPGETFVAPEGSGVTEEQLRDEHITALHATQPEADTANTEAESTDAEVGDAENAAAENAAAEDAATAAVELTDETGAAFRLEGGVAKFYFATGKAKVIDGAADKIAGIVQELKEGNRKAVLSGFVDPRGSVEQNAVLAKKRAETVRDLLLAQGVAEDAIELRKPSDIVPEGADYAELRRVELTLENR